VIFGLGRADLEQVSAAEAISLSAGDSILVDVREDYEWDAGHAPQAINVPMSRLDERMSDLPPDLTLLIICLSGHRSVGVTARLERAGYSAVNVEGGMLAWVDAGGPIVASDEREPRV